jgi:hypothetical protein
VLYDAFAALLVAMQDQLGFSTVTFTAAFSPCPGGGRRRRPPGRAMMGRPARGPTPHEPRVGGSGAAAVHLVARAHDDRPAPGVRRHRSCLGALVLHEPALAVIVGWFRTQRTKALLTIALGRRLSAPPFSCPAPPPDDA